VKIESLPPPASMRRATQEAGRWTPAALAVVVSALLPLIREWRGGPPELVTEVAALRSTVTSQGEAIAKLKVDLQSAEETLVVYKAASSKWGEYVDASLCVLGVRPPYGCPGVELLPRPLKASSARQIQPRIEGLKPL
jgi:hypothetical protein